MNKNNHRSTPAKKSSGSTVMGVFIGLVLGLLVAFILVWLFNRMPLPFREHEGSAAADQAASSSSSLPGKPGDKPRAKQDLEFYDLLEGKPAKNQATDPAALEKSSVKPAIPTDQVEEKLQRADSSTDEVPAVTPPADVFYLQVGAFQNMADVENLKAKLAVQGFEATIQEVAIPNKGVMQRVRVGPFPNLAAMASARNTLLQSGIQTTVVKQKELPKP
jgi:cell division protein FtsN